MEYVFLGHIDFVTFLVTAITVRIWPLNIVSEDYYQGQEGTPEVQPKGNRLKAAWDEGMSVANDSLPLLKNVWINFKDGVIMAASILPTILSVGLLGLILSTYTPVFDIIGYIFYPFTLLVQLPEPLLAAKAAAVEIAEMFLPALMVVDASLVTKFVMGFYPFQRLFSSLQRFQQSWQRISKSVFLS